MADRFLVIDFNIWNQEAQRTSNHINTKTKQKTKPMCIIPSDKNARQEKISKETEKRTYYLKRNKVTAIVNFISETM